MDHITFSYLGKRNFGRVLPQLFDILYTNMSKIAPTQNTYDEDYKVWLSVIFQYLQ